MTRGGSPPPASLTPPGTTLGGTADRSYTAKDFISELQDKGVRAEWFMSREEIAPHLVNEARKGDRFVVMGARDDTLSDFARELLERL